MLNVDSFRSLKKFFGQEHFPYGLSRSGKFTKKQVALLEAHGIAYQELHSRQREPLNEEENDFVMVCEGKRAPQTDHERVWIHYCKKVEESGAVISFVVGGSDDLAGSFYADDEW